MPQYVLLHGVHILLHYRIHCMCVANRYVYVVAAPDARRLLIFPGFAFVYTRLKELATLMVCLSVISSSCVVDSRFAGEIVIFTLIVVSASIFTTAQYLPEYRGVVCEGKCSAL